MVVIINHISSEHCGNKFLREVAGGKPAKTEADVPLLQKSDRRKLLLQLCGNTAFGCGLGAGDRRRSRHALIKIFT